MPPWPNGPTWKFDNIVLNVNWRSEISLWYARCNKQRGWKLCIPQGINPSVNWEEDIIYTSNATRYSLNFVTRVKARGSVLSYHTAFHTISGKGRCISYMLYRTGVHTVSVLYTRYGYLYYLAFSSVILQSKVGSQLSSTRIFTFFISHSTIVCVSTIICHNWLFCKIRITRTIRRMFSAKLLRTLPWVCVA